jgi:RNA recognition motif-containing protein
VDEKTLHQFFRRYGNLKFAKVVINKETGLSKGSGFLKFIDAAKAKELVEYSRDYEMNLLGKNPNFKQNPGINL